MQMGGARARGRSPLQSAQRMKCGHPSLFTLKHSCLTEAVSLKVPLPLFWSVLQLGPRSQSPEWFKLRTFATLPSTVWWRYPVMDTWRFS